MTAATTLKSQPTGAGSPAPHRETRGGRKTWSDILVLSQRNLRHMVRDPFEVVVGASTPLVMALLFGYVFGDAMSATGAEEYRTFLVPAMLAMVMLHGIAGTAAGIARDTDRGVMSRFRSMPMSPMAILGARTLTDMIRATLEIVVLLLGCAALMGWRFENGLGGALAAVGLILLFRFALVWLGVVLGLLIPNPDAAGALVYPLTFPVAMLSTSFLPAAAMPSWLSPVAEWNPMSAVVTATRDLFGNPSLPTEAWPSQNALLLALLIPTLVIAVCAPMAVRRFRSLSR